MKTSLITATSGVTSQADESSESFIIMFLNSEKTLLNLSLLLPSEGADISLICLLLSWDLLQKVFIKLHYFSLVVLYFG